MKKLLLIFLLFSSLVARTQSKVSDDSLPHESISMHLNTTVYLTGETLLFSVYCVNDPTKALSDFSRIAYVELIDNKQKAISQMKVKLDHGTGSGDFYFDSRIPSGNYTLIAYTRWMRNFGPQSFYRQTITVVNADQLPSQGKSSNASQQMLPMTPESTSSVKVALDKMQYRQRERIAMRIIQQDGTDIQFSVNVRLLESRPEFDANQSHSAEEHSLRQSEIRFLPDLRGELVTGTIKNKTTGKPLKNELVTLSSPSANSGFLLSRTDSAGRFYFNVNNFQSSFMLVKPLNALADDFTIAVDNSFCEEHQGFAPPEFQVDSAFLKSLANRYLSAQIENAFYEVKKDSVMKPSPDKLFIPDKIFRLDDFTRFPTMEDVFREIVPEVIVKAKQGEFSLSIRNNETGERFYNTPLMLVDGIPVSSTELMNYNPLLVKRISVVNRRYYLAGLETEGIISLETYKGIAENINTSHMQRISYTAPLSDKLYYSPAYDTNSRLTRIPDYRTQLYWNAGIKASTSTTLTFFASDVSGEYMVEVVGVKSNGEKISAYQKFSVGK